MDTARVPSQMPMVSHGRRAEALAKLEIPFTRFMVFLPFLFTTILIGQAFSDNHQKDEFY
jgi:hypothetical protein